MSEVQIEPRRFGRSIVTLGAVSTVGLFAVNIMGFVDTETGSAFGCGPDWPLCKGQLIPSTWGEKTIIEYGHRAIVGFVTLLLVTLAIWAWIRYGKNLKTRLLIGIMMLFVFVQAVLGALAAVFTNPPWVIALHFGFSLLAFSGVSLLTLAIRQYETGGRPVGHYLNHTPTGRTSILWTWFTFAYTYCAIYFGAYISSTGAGSSFSGWPFPTDLNSKAPHVAVLDIGHRILALGLVALIVVLLVRFRTIREERPDLYKGSMTALVFVVLQAITGSFLVFSHFSLWAFLVHVSVMTLFFAVLTYIVLQVSFLRLQSQ